MTDDERWTIVEGRDAAFDGAFIYAVASTGVYCRPSCPSRRPGRARVVFFELPEAAEQAGYRACRRCRPREAPAPDARVAAIRAACGFIEAHDEGPPRLAELADHVGLSPHHLQRTFKRLVGVSPRAYADALRLERLKARLRAGDDVTGALYEAGYGSASRLYERARATLGMTPATYRRGGKGARIAYTVIACPFDRLLVAATSRGVCAVYLGDDDAALVRALHAEYPAAEIAHDDDGFGDWAADMLAHLEGARAHIDLPLDVLATAFQRRVWQALQAIPYGETRSYGAVARAIGRPGAARAVARACASNPVSVIVPCHRVVREDGGLGGYRWGLDRKRALLATERAAAHDG